MKAQLRGVLNFKQSLPLSWDLHNYSEEEVNELEFVMEFISQEKGNEEEDPFELTNPSIQSKEVITMGMLGSKDLGKREYRSSSLR